MRERTLGVLFVVAFALVATLAFLVTRDADAPTRRREANVRADRAKFPAELEDPTEVSTPVPPTPGRVIPPDVPGRRDAIRGASATLVVTVIASTDGRPLAGIAVTAHAREGGFEPIASSDPTDSSGRTELEVPSGVRILLAAEERAPASGLALDQTAPLLPGERREFRLLVHPGDDERVFVRVAACGTGAPIRDALVQACRVFPFEQVIRESTTDVEGRCELALPAESDLFLRVRAPGMAPVGARVESRMSSRSDPQTVCLEIAASVTIVVRDGSGRAIPGARLRLSAVFGMRDVDPDAWSNPPGIELSGTTDADGVARFTELSVGVPILVSVSVEGSSSALEDLLTTFAPGEDRSLERVVGSGCRIDGVLTDDGDRPVANANVMLRRPIEQVGAELCRERSASTTSDMDGRFTFEGVAPGAWTLAIGYATVDAESQRIAGEPVTFRLDDTQRSHAVSMKVYRRLSIAGRVFLRDEPAASTEVVAREVRNRWSVSAMSAPDGTFRLEPLIAGRYELSSSGSPTRMFADAGDSRLELRLHAGGSLHVRVIDSESGAECDAKLALARRDSGTREWTELNPMWFDGYEIEALEPGRYDISAGTRDRRYGEVRDVVVEDGRASREGCTTGCAW